MVVLEYLNHGCATTRFGLTCTSSSFFRTLSCPCALLAEKIDKHCGGSKCYLEHAGELSAETRNSRIQVAG